MYRLASKEQREQTIVYLETAPLGGGTFAMIAGPCAIEDREQIEATARFVRDRGAIALRGGAYKPRTSPYSFQGLGDEAVELIGRASLRFGVPCVVEALAEEQLPLLARHVGMIQIGARNMQNFDLLKEVGQTQRPVLLKRGMSATVKDLLMSAEYVLSEGNPGVVLCERGVRSFEDSTRNMLDMSAVPNVKGLSHLPIIVDPSHATGRPDLIPSMACAAVAAGADGVHIEVHSCPEKALSDGPQALLPRQYLALTEDLRKLAALMGKTI